MSLETRDPVLHAFWVESRIPHYTIEDGSGVPIWNRPPLEPQVTDDWIASAGVLIDRLVRSGRTHDARVVYVLARFACESPRANNEVQGHICDYLDEDGQPADFSNDEFIAAIRSI